jgi:COX assembly protein 2
MHPQLIIHKHEGCEGVIEALDQCHKANSFNKFLGFCNDAKREVDQCLKEEVRLDEGNGWTKN